MLEIETFRTGLLPNAIVKKLIETSEAIAEMRTLINVNAAPQVLNSALFINEIRYRNALEGYEFTYEDILLSIAGINASSNLYTQIKNYNMAKEIAINQVDKFDILSSTDFLIVNETLKGSDGISDITVLSNQKESTLKEIRGILTDLYNPQSEYPLLLEFAIAIYRLLKLSKTYKIDLLAIKILLMTLYKTEGLIFYLSKHFIIYDSELEVERNSTERSIEIILNILESSVRDSVKLLYVLNKEINTYGQDLKERLPKLYSEELKRAITQNFYTRNIIIEKEMRVSPKTAITYLKTLEQNGFLSAVKIGKEKVYINRQLLNVIDDGLKGI